MGTSASKVPGWTMRAMVAYHHRANNDAPPLTNTLGYMKNNQPRINNTICPTQYSYRNSYVDKLNNVWGDEVKSTIGDLRRGKLVRPAGGCIFCLCAER